MSELDEQTWAVLSERGVETSGVIYAAARLMVERLRAEDVRGLCIITAQTAQCFTDAKMNLATQNQSPSPGAI